MTTDEIAGLVERLRRMVDNTAPTGRMTARKQTDLEAADAIERLSVEVATLRRAGDLLVILDAVYKLEGVEKWLAHHTNQLHAIDDGNYQ